MLLSALAYALSPTPLHHTPHITHHFNRYELLRALEESDKTARSFLASPNKDSSLEITPTGDPEVDDQRRKFDL